MSAREIHDELVKEFGLSEAIARRYYPILKKVGHRLPLKAGAYSTLDRIGWERYEAAVELKHSDGVLNLVQDLSRGRSLRGKSQTAPVSLRWRQTSYGYLGTTVEADDWPSSTPNGRPPGSHKFELHIGDGDRLRLGYTGPLFYSGPNPVAGGASEYLCVGDNLACKQDSGVEALVQMRLERVRDIAETYLIREQLQHRLQTGSSSQPAGRLATG